MAYELRYVKCAGMRNIRWILLYIKQFYIQIYLNRQIFLHE